MHSTGAYFVSLPPKRGRYDQVLALSVRLTHPYPALPQIKTQSGDRASLGCPSHICQSDGPKTKRGQRYIDFSRLAPGNGVTSNLDKATTPHLAKCWRYCTVACNSLQVGCLPKFS